MELIKLPMISLQRQALTNFASSVWVKANKQSLRSALVAEPLNDGENAELKRSNIPTLFKEMTMMILTDVGHEIIMWLNEIKDHVDDTTLEHQLANLSWTIEGPLNRPKMARLLLQNQRGLGLLFRFCTACVYCLEDEVRELWPRIRDEQQPNDFGCLNFMEKYWIYKIDGQLLDINSFVKKAVLHRDGTSIDVKFFLSVVSRYYNIETVKFLFNSLSDEDKIEALNIFKSWPVNDICFHCEQSVFAYLLSQLNVMEMCDVISRCDLTLFTNIRYYAWPNTEFVKAFDQHVCKMKGTMPATNGTDLIKLADGAFQFVRRYNEKILFRYCWTRFPKEELNKAMYDPDLTRLLGIFDLLIGNNDDVSIKMVIDSIEPRGHAQYLLSYEGLTIIKTLAKYNSLILKYYLARTLYSETLVVNLLKKSITYDFEENISGILNEMFPSLDLISLI